MAPKQLIRSLHVRPGTPAGLAGRDPGDRLGFPDKQDGLERLGEQVTQLGSLHNRLWAESRRSLLLVLQGLDASGKDGTIRHVLTGVNPQGCRSDSTIPRRRGSSAARTSTIGRAGTTSWTSTRR